MFIYINPSFLFYCKVTISQRCSLGVVSFLLRVGYPEFLLLLFPVAHLLVISLFNVSPSGDIKEKLNR